MYLTESEHASPLNISVVCTKVINAAMPLNLKTLDVSLDKVQIF